jgi:Polysaccharide lyase family 4, domain II
MCLNMQKGWRSASLAMLDAAKADPSILIYTATTDENGDFEFKNVKPGVYDIHAIGRAGLRDGEWQASIPVKPGPNPFVKLSTPDRSCPSIEEEVDY